MVNQQLLDYIRQQLAAGVSKEEIIQSLITTGWQGQDINDAFSTIGTQIAPQQMQQAPTTTFVQSTVGQNNSPHGKKKWPVILITAVILLLLGGGAAFAYYVLQITPSELAGTNQQATSSPMISTNATSSAADVYYAQETFISTASSTLNNIPVATSTTWSFYAYDPQTTETKKVAALETDGSVADSIDARQLTLIQAIPAVAILAHNNKEVDLLNLSTGDKSVLFNDNLATTSSRGTLCKNAIQGIAVGNDGKSVLIDTVYGDGYCIGNNTPLAGDGEGYVRDEAFLFTYQGDGTFKQTKQLRLPAGADWIQSVLVNNTQLISVQPGIGGPAYLSDLDFRSGENIATIVGNYVVNGTGTEVAFVGDNAFADSKSCYLGDPEIPLEADSRIQILDVATGNTHVAYQASDQLKGFKPVAFSADGNSLLFSEDSKRSIENGCIVDTPYIYPDIAPHYNLNLKTGDVTPVSNIAQWTGENKTTVKETAFNSAIATSTMLLVNGKVAASLAGDSQSLIIWNFGANLIL